MVIPKGQKSLNGFRKFGPFIGRSPSDGAASMAVEGLRQREAESLYCANSVALKPVLNWVNVCSRT